MKERYKGYVIDPQVLQRSDQSGWYVSRIKIFREDTLQQTAEFPLPGTFASKEEGERTAIEAAKKRINNE